MRNTDSFDVNNYLGYAGHVQDLAREGLINLAPKKDEKILDIGCGEGTITKIIADSGAEVYGIDANEKMVAAAVRNGVNAFVRQADDLKFSDGEFDKVYSNSALHWVPDRDVAIKEMGRVLKDGGKIALEFAYKSPPHIKKAVVEAAKEHGYGIADKDPWYETKPADLKKWLNSAGFEDIKVTAKSKLQNFPDGMQAWLNQFVSNTFLKDIPETDKKLILDKAVEKLKKFPNYFSTASEPEWYGDYQRVNVTAKLNKERYRILDSQVKAPAFGKKGLAIS